MMNFNKEFEKLKTEAEKHDYYFSSNGTFIKEPRNIPIMEICLISASTYIHFISYDKISKIFKT